LSDRELFFFVEVLPQPDFDDLLVELTSKMLLHVQLAEPAAAELTAAIQIEIDKHMTDPSRARVLEFRVRDRQLVVSLSQAGGGEWRVTRPLP
jgi:hypothetical protein